jgi:hypothetical protein
MVPKIIIHAALLMLILMIAGGAAASVISHGLRPAERKLKVYPGDMPLESDVFRVPAGYNAPQQVQFSRSDH